MEIAMLLITIMIVVIALLLGRVTETQHPFPFTKKGSLFSHTERSFLKLIEKAVGDEFKVVSRVRLGDIVTLRNNLSKRSQQNAINKANSRYLDFVICNKETLDVVGVIDLVNVRDQNGHKQRKDWFLSGTLDASGIPYIRIQIRNGYSAKDIRDCIYQKLSRKGIVEPRVRGARIPAPLVRPTAADKDLSLGAQDKSEPLIQMT